MDDRQPHTVVHISKPPRHLDDDLLLCRLAQCAPSECEVMIPQRHPRSRWPSSLSAVDTEAGRSVIAHENPPPNPSSPPLQSSASRSVLFLWLMHRGWPREGLLSYELGKQIQHFLYTLGIEDGLGHISQATSAG
ncbi:hypothetical protein KSP39_PZI021503 [Platanthera zijinensis]|uniref:Uncharacterized protein n=1 Tax=Platanthera zijinensis TaxID=2320716 RepID=A0AAP0FVM1_9ASPA